MAVVKPIRAVRYDESVAGPLERLVAPPYDVIGAEEREELLEPSSATPSRPSGRSSRSTSGPTASSACAAGWSPR